MVRHPRGVHNLIAHRNKLTGNLTRISTLSRVSERARIPKDINHIYEYVSRDHNNLNLPTGRPSRAESRRTVPYRHLVAIIRDCALEE